VLILFVVVSACSCGQNDEVGFYNATRDMCEEVYKVIERDVTHNHVYYTPIWAKENQELHPANDLLFLYLRDMFAKKNMELKILSRSYDVQSRWFDKFNSKIDGYIATYDMVARVKEYNTIQIDSYSAMGNLKINVFDSNREEYECARDAFLPVGDSGRSVYVFVKKYTASPLRLLFSNNNKPVLFRVATEQLVVCLPSLPESVEVEGYNKSFSLNTNRFPRQYGPYSVQGTFLLHGLEL
jgi:hypothetical protein